MSSVARKTKGENVVSFDEKKISKIETMLGTRFVSDPRRSRFPIPVAPAEFREKYPTAPYTVPFTITPEIARDWLTYRVIRKEITPRELLHADFCPNRRFLIGALTGSPRRKGWIDIVKDGELLQIHQGFAFTPDGFLCDGQHRLAAIVLSGTTADDMQVSVDVDWKGFAVMDSARGRTAGQLLGDDLPYADNCASAARYIIPVLNGMEDRVYMADTVMASKQEVIDLVSGWGFFDGNWSKDVAVISATMKVPAIPLLATVIMALGAGADVDQVQQFLNGLKKTFRPQDYIAIGTNGIDPRWVLRNAFSNRVTTSKDKYGNAGLIRRCMTVWLNQEKVGELSRTPANRNLPPVWNADKVRQYHADRIS